MRVWTGTDRIVVRVHDNGPGPADPLTGLIPAPGGSAGAGLGLWLIHQFTNIDIALLAAADGFTVRLRGGRPPAPAESAAEQTRRASEPRGRRIPGDLGAALRWPRFRSREPDQGLDQSHPHAHK